jgi:hypothetical protein
MIPVLHVKSRNGVADSGMGWLVPTDEEGTHTGLYGHLATTTAPFSWISPNHAAQKISAGRKIRSLSDALPVEMLHSSIGRRDRQTTRHSVKHSNGAGHLKTARGKGAD